MLAAHRFPVAWRWSAACRQQHSRWRVDGHECRGDEVVLWVKPMLLKLRAVPI
jgi:hypothetical protein